MKMLIQVLLLTICGIAVGSADEPISNATGTRLLNQYGCQSCHAVDKTPAGPGLRDIAKKYASDPSAIAELEASVLNGSSGAWGTDSMPPNQVPDGDLKSLVEWILSLFP
jgi:cytochrome c551/c552